MLLRFEGVAGVSEFPIWLNPAHVVSVAPHSRGAMIRLLSGEAVRVNEAAEAVALILDGADPAGPVQP